MSYINTNVSSLVARQNLAKSSADEQTALTRLSTGLRINSGADDPSGLIAANALGSDITGVNTAISNSQQANEVVATAAGALTQVSTLLNTIRGLVTQAANSGALSSAQIAANQSQVDASLQAINQISSTTQFQGKNLLDGTLAFTTSSVSSTNIANLNIQQATIGSSGSVALNVSVTTAAAKASIDTTVNSSSTGLAAQQVIEIGGASGSQVYTFGTGTTATQIQNAINLDSAATGVTAAQDSSGELFLYSQNYGSSQDVSYKTISTTGTALIADTRATGTDVAGNINGSAFTGDGLNISLKTASLSLSSGLTAAFGTTTGSTSFNITGGGATFQIGSDVQANQQVRIGIQSVNSAELGGVVAGAQHSLFEIGSGQTNNLSADPSTAESIVNAAIQQVSVLQGTLGALQSTTLNSNEASLNNRLTNLTQAQSQIQDANFAQETANLTRAQILVQSGTSVLQIANNAPQQILSLLPRG